MSDSGVKSPVSVELDEFLRSLQIQLLQMGAKIELLVSKVEAIDSKVEMLLMDEDEDEEYDEKEELSLEVLPDRYQSVPPHPGPISSLPVNSLYSSQPSVPSSESNFKSSRR